MASDLEGLASFDPRTSLAVENYFDILCPGLSGQNYSKAEHRHTLMVLLNR